jgi:hypothetical protein
MPSKGSLISYDELLSTLQPLKTTTKPLNTSGTCLAIPISSSISVHSKINSSFPLPVFPGSKYPHVVGPGFPIFQPSDLDDTSIPLRESANGSPKTNNEKVIPLLFSSPNNNCSSPQPLYFNSFVDYTSSTTTVPLITLSNPTLVSPIPALQQVSVVNNAIIAAHFNEKENFRNIPLTSDISPSFELTPYFNSFVDYTSSTTTVPFITLSNPTLLPHDPIPALQQVSVVNTAVVTARFNENFGNIQLTSDTPPSVEPTPRNPLEKKLSSTSMLYSCASTSFDTFDLPSLDSRDFISSNDLHFLDVLRMDSRDF